MPKLLAGWVGPTRRGAKLTQDGHVVGTPGYLAPEALDASWGRPERATVGDVFAFGALGWRLLMRESSTKLHPSGVEPPATLGDYAVAYSDFARNQLSGSAILTWPAPTSLGCAVAWSSTQAAASRTAAKSSRCSTQSLDTRNSRRKASTGSGGGWGA